MFFYDSGIHACFAVNVSCILPTQSFDVGCFEDSTVFDRCFAHCPNNCNFRGTCDNGFCSCDSPYGGTDCSSIVVCPNNCTDSLHGSCDRTNGVCQCTTGFGGADCSVLSSSIDSSSSSRFVKTTFLILYFFISFPFSFSFSELGLDG